MTKVLISGASIAGPTLAYWLRRHGFTVTVVERAPKPREGGQAVDLRGAARDVIERMGLLDTVRAHHTGVVGLSAVDQRNRRVWSWGSDLSGDSGGIIADLEILRADLGRILYEASRDGVEYIFDDSIIALHEHAGGVDVTFASGGSRTFDVVVGADGLHSNVRRLAFGPEPGFVQDQGYYKVIFATGADVPLDDWQLMYVMPGRRRASLYPTRGGRTRGMFFFAGPEIDHDRRDVQRQKRFVADAMAGAGWQVPRMLESMWDTTDFYIDREYLVTIEEWSRGRVALLGDAVFGGSAGMGTSMAVVGAYVLAGELAAADGDHVRAFARYRQVLDGYVRDNKKPMPGGKNLFLPKGRGMIWLGNQTTRLMLAGPWRSMLTGDLQGKAGGVTLEDYAGPGKVVDGASRREDALQ
ncbi:FAD-dependent monooxygenase [Amycolatopsis sp. GM8]|uniref:FAD-dependent monooxygenase n=1 Tax=Amycolatopsis sp. GM8 TaxID=2896530 RepID=UPI001F0077FA|nr:FAD-dependent monooxygenase [Amycolatopsis sp. GM8]